MAANGQLTVAAILVAAGAGQRLGAGRPKALCLLGGRTLTERAVARFAAHPAVRDVVVVAPPTHLAEVAELVARVQSQARVVAGGALRPDSVCRGLDATAPDVDAVLVHDVARPFVPAAVISRVVAALSAGAVGVIPAVAVTDTVKRVESGRVRATLARESLRAVQTPQGFRREVLVAAYARARSEGLLADVTDDASVLEAAGHPVDVVAGDQHSLKITTPWDLRIAELLATVLDRDGQPAAADALGEPR
ncbi:MAG TPA: 2-C-methyl-D-erythritol 4-phosphate cytidylyltransferase [Jatrophihabitantaceae bacterium]|jgi:2-C-methyl-D-erythritol 4-phosphate cytidylyltransferase